MFVRSLAPISSEHFAQFFAVFGKTALPMVFPRPS